MLKALRVAICGFTALSLLVFASPVVADSSRVNDPQGDRDGSVDFKYATHGHTESGRLRHKVVGYNRLGESPPCVDIQVGPQDNRSFYSVCREGVYDFSGDAPPNTRTGDVTVRRPDPRTIIYIFSKRAIGRPALYKWSADGTGECGPECFFDRIPNRGLVTHRL